MGWQVFNFECDTPEKREALVEWFEANHDVQRREPNNSHAPEKSAEATSGEGGPSAVDDGQELEIAADVVLSTEDGTIEAEMVWIDSYLYLTVTEDPGPLLEKSASHWNRAVRAKIDTGSAGCPVAVLYSTIGSHAVEIARHQGGPGNAAIDVMYIFAMVHQFRFRAYADVLPTLCSIPFPSAFDTPAATDPDSDRVEQMVEITDVEPTSEGIRFFERDPMRDEENRPALGPGERLASGVRSRFVRPLRTALIAVRARF